LEGKAKRSDSMSGGLFALTDRLKELNASLNRRRRERPTAGEIRSALATAGFEFCRASRLTDGEIRKLFQGRALVGVDGSVNQVGNYPYVIHLFKALAKSSRADQQGLTAVEHVDLFSPLQEGSRRVIDDFLALKRHELAEAAEDPEARTDLEEQQAYAMYVEQRMVELELEAAMEAIERFHPYLLLMDGGFSRLKGKGGEKWEQFERLAVDEGVLVVGVIEEVGSYRLKSRLDEVNPELMKGFIRGHDREVLFNTLQPGEWLMSPLDRPIKKEFYTVFARLSDLPQAGACDFLRDQVERVPLDEIMDFLYTMTPEKSRGVPLWLDLVDAQVRLTHKQIDLAVKASVDLENIETFLRPQRERRDM
jgi:hypothetical protein